MIVVFILLIGFVIFLGLSSNHQYIKERTIKINNCNQIESCDKYKCLAEITSLYNAQRNYLLQEQNCLLREDSA